MDSADEGVRRWGVEGRGGIHTGEVERMIEKIGGIAVCVRAHVAILAQPGGR